MAKDVGMMAHGLGPLVEGGSVVCATGHTAGSGSCFVSIAGLRDGLAYFSRTPQGAVTLEGSDRPLSLRTGLLVTENT